MSMLGALFSKSKVSSMASLKFLSCNVSLVIVPGFALSLLEAVGRKNLPLLSMHLSIFYLI